MPASKNDSNRDGFLNDLRKLFESKSLDRSVYDSIVATFVLKELGDKGKLLKSKHIKQINDNLDNFWNKLWNGQLVTINQAIEEARIFARRIKELFNDLPCPKREFFQREKRFLQFRQKTVIKCDQIVLLPTNSCFPTTVYEKWRTPLPTLILSLFLVILAGRLFYERKFGGAEKRRRLKISNSDSVQQKKSNPRDNGEKFNVSPPLNSPLTPPPTPTEIRTISPKSQSFPLLKCVCCDVNFTYEEQNAFEIECNLKVSSFFTHEECFKETLAKQGLNGSKRKEWKTADCVENNCAGHLIFIRPIKKGRFYEKPVYCD